MSTNNLLNMTLKLANTAKPEFITSQTFVHYENQVETNNQVLQTVATAGTISTNICSDTVIINGQEVDFLGTTITDEQIIRNLSQSTETTTPDPTSANNDNNSAASNANVGNSTSSAGLPSKEAILNSLYQWYNPQISFTSDYGGNEGFNNTNELFAYLDNVFEGAGTSKQITKAQLTKLTQNDDFEDAHNDFFGAINRAFSNRKADDYITYDDINNLIVKAAGNDHQLSQTELNTKVLQYADKVQKQFESCTMEQRVDFIIDKTRDYLKSVNLQPQLNALDRLLNLEDDDINNNHKYNKGKIAFVDMEGSQLGGYQFTLGVEKIYTPHPNYNTAHGNGRGYYAYLWAGDEDVEFDDNSTADGGLTLNSLYLDASVKQWYEAVATLVHELTHACAYQYAILEDDYVLPSQIGIDRLKDCGAIAQGDYNNFQKYLVDMDFDQTDNEQWEIWNELYNYYVYLTSTLWGEYAAYQTDADYADSIAGDIFDTQSGDIISGDGVDEKTKIEAQVATYEGYDDNPSSQPYPAHQWWTYNNQNLNLYF